jgi:Baseplate J-like protein
VTSVAPAELREALNDDPVIFETVHDVAALTLARNKIEIYTWGDQRCCLPTGATTVTLDITDAAAGLEAGDVLVFEEVFGPETGLEADADPSHRQAVRLDRAPVEVEDRLTGQRVLEVSWFAADALTWPLCLWIPPGQTDQASVARANVVLADHGMTCEGTADEPLLSPVTVPDMRRYRPVLADEGLTFRVPYDAAASRRQPARDDLATDPRRATPDVMLRGDGDAWLPEGDLIATDRFDSRFVVEMEADRRAFLRFGDDVRGRRPSPGATFTARYRVGNGTPGNVGAEAIGRLVLPDGINKGDVNEVRNPLAAVGGTEPEVIEEVRLHAGQAFRSQERAVTDTDYAFVTNRHADVQRSAATRRWTGSWHTVFVTTDRRRGAVIDTGFEEDIRQFVEPFRMAGHDLEVDAPRFVPLDVALTVCALPGHVRADVERALLEAFGVTDLPDGGQGFFHPDAFTFGQPVYLSRIVARAMSVPGVDWVDVDDADGKPNRFRRWGQPARGEIAAGRISMGRLEIARLDNDPNRPENGRLEFFLRGGL